MQKIFITKKASETRKLGEMMAKELEGSEILALEGELGAGKTIFSQGILCGIGAKGPFTSPTFVIMKQYEIKNKKAKTKTKSRDLKIIRSGIQNIYHIDAYRIGTKDILDLGWDEIIKNKNNVIVIEWANRVKKIIPARAIWIKFKWISKNERKIILKDNY